MKGGINMFNFHVVRRRVETLIRLEENDQTDMTLDKLKVPGGLGDCVFHGKFGEDKSH